MYFNTISYDLLPSWLVECISETQNRLPAADNMLKYGVIDLFEALPFNLVSEDVIRKKMDDIREQYIRESRKVVRRDRGNGLQYIVSRDELFNEESLTLLNKTFDFRSASLLVKKGVSSAGREALVIPESCPLPLFFFRTVYPLCSYILSEKNKFSIARHPLHPLFHRYMHEPLAVAMSIALTATAFGDEARIVEFLSSRMWDYPKNYRAGVQLYSCGLHLRWKDWRDESNRCSGKIDTMKEWIKLFSGNHREPEDEQIISLWAKLFDLTDVEKKGLMSAAKYAPVISESVDLPDLLLGLLEYVDKNSGEIDQKPIRSSNNPIAQLIVQLVDKVLPLSNIQMQIPLFSKEPIIRDFISEDMPEWSFSRDLNTGCFRIYGPAVMAVRSKRGHDSEK